MPYCQSYFNSHFFLYFQPLWLFCRQTPAVVKMQDTLVSEQQLVLCPLQMCLWLGFSRLFWDRSDGDSAGERGLLQAPQLVSLLPVARRLLSIIATELLAALGWGRGAACTHLDVLSRSPQVLEQTPLTLLQAFGQFPESCKSWFDKLCPFVFSSVEEWTYQGPDSASTLDF